MSTARRDRRAGEIERGVDAETHLEFIDWVEAHPENAILEFRASDITEEVPNRPTATIGDQPELLPISNRYLHSKLYFVC